MVQKLREFAIENNTPVNISNLEPGWINEEDYSFAHSTLIIPCHDIIVKYKQKALLVHRESEPFRGELWPLGGRINRCISIEDSLKRKIKAESNLSLQNLQFLGVARTIGKTDPFDHGYGTDTLNLMYLGTGRGNLQLDKSHRDPVFLSKGDYTKEFKATLHPYTAHIMDLTMRIIKFN